MNEKEERKNTKKYKERQKQRKGRKNEKKERKKERMKKKERTSKNNIILNKSFKHFLHITQIRCKDQLRQHCKKRTPLLKNDIVFYFDSIVHLLAQHIDQIHFRLFVS